MQNKLKKINFTIISALLAFVIAVVCCLSSLLGTTNNGTMAKVRTINVAENTINYEKVISEFDDAQIIRNGSVTTLECVNTIDLSDFDLFDNVSESDIQDSIGCQFTYNATYDAELNIVTLTATILGEVPIIESIFGAAFIDENGRLDAVLEIEGETIYLSELQDLGMIQNCGWFSKLIKKATKSVKSAISEVVDTAKNIVKEAIENPVSTLVSVASVVACVATAGLATGAVIAIGAAVSCAESVATQLIKTGTVSAEAMLLDTAFGAIPGGNGASKFAKASLKAGAETTTEKIVKETAEQITKQTADQALEATVKAQAKIAAKNISKEYIDKLSKFGFKIENGAILNKVVVKDGVVQYLDDAGKVFAQKLEAKLSNGTQVHYLMKNVDISEVKSVVGEIPASGLQKVVGRFDDNGALLENWDNVLASERQKAVKLAWEKEIELVQLTGKGTREWSKIEIEQLRKGAKIEGYEGHHINSVAYNPQDAGNPSNIAFGPKQEHIDDFHGGSYRNPTYGKHIDRDALIVQVKN